MINITDDVLFDVPFWNEVMEQGPTVWAALRERLKFLLAAGSEHEEALQDYMVKQDDVKMHMPFRVSEFTDFYASKHHAMNVGDLIGSGTISGPRKSERGSLLEITWGGTEPMILDTGETRTFIEDGDTLTLGGSAKGDGFQIGFGVCSREITPAFVY